MRIIYDSDRNSRALAPIPHSGRANRETVIIISSDRKSVDKRDEVRISGEAVARNTEVRAHEMAHMAALGSAAASGIIYDTVKGPGGETLAVGGRIAVDLSEVPGDPAATLRKALSVITAANAPGNPSAGDMRTAAKAYDLARKAQQQMTESLSIDIRA